MANYTKLTDFAAKDTLPSGNAAKIVKGTEIDDELAAIESAVSSKAEVDSPAFTGTPTSPTASAGTNSTQIATTAFVANALSNISLDANWSVVGSGTTLTFAYDGTNVFQVDSTGNMVVIGNVTAYGTI